MGHRYQKNGEDMIHFDNGLWDSVFGYTCRNCGTVYADTESAFAHDCKQPCQVDPSFKRGGIHVKISLFEEPD